MIRLQETSIACPYCGEQMTVLVDAQEDGSEYIEDCQVCCRPIVFHISAHPDGGLDVGVRTEDDTY
jgi:transcription elongation factor Elf1